MYRRGASPRGIALNRTAFLSRHRSARRSALVVLLVLLLDLAVATGALAVTWSAPNKLTLSRNGTAWDSLVVTGTSSVHVAYQEARGGILRVHYRRSTDVGATFGAPVLLSRPNAILASGANLAAYGTKIDAVFVERVGGGSVVRYRRSTDNGRTWSAPLTLSPSTGLADFPQVARDSAGRVFVSWTNGKNGRINVRRSTDGGTTFLAAVQLATTASQPYGSSYYEGFPHVATGNGVVYVAWYQNLWTVRVRRSTDGGATWQPGLNVATDGNGYYLLDLAAAGSAAVLGYVKATASDIYTVVRRTSNKGASWLGPVAISSPSAAYAFHPLLSHRNGVWRAVFERCSTNACTSSRTYYTESTNGGATWLPVALASKSTRPYVFPGGLAATGSAVFLLLGDYKVDVDDADVYVRVGSP